MNGKAVPLRSRDAFTLIEVLLALSIFSLMGTILYGAFSLGHSAVEKSQGAFAKNQKLRSIGDLLGSYIRSSHPYRVSPQDPAIFFEGAQDSLTFVSGFSLAMGGRGMAKIEISREGEDDDSGALRLTEETPVRVGEGAGEGAQRSGIRIEEGIRDLRFAYLDPEATEEKWEEIWGGQERRMLPRAVRLTYRTRDGKEVRWIFPVMMTVLAQSP
jgi:prepilin-type N-terminal cleavage/methylation domain-containing protein